MKKKNEIVVLFNNYYDVEEEEQSEWCELDDLIDDVENNNSGAAWIAGGSVGRWNGTHHGYKMFNSFKKMVYCILQDCAYVKVYIENGKLFVQGTHHDGTISMECKLVNGRGWNVYNGWNYGYSKTLNGASEYDVLEKVFNNNLFSKKIAV